MSGERAGHEETHRVPLPNQLRMHSPEGSVTEFQLGFPEYWSPPVVVVARKDHPPVELDLVRAGTVSGKILPAPAGPPPTAITATFRWPLGESGGTADEILVECPIEDQRFRCELPSGLTDLQLRVPGFVSHFFWGLPVPRGGDFAIGSLRLRRGGSIVGTVEVAGGALSFEGVTVEAEPLNAADGGDAERRRQLRRTASVTRRGFFHLAGLPAGRYRVTAVKNNFGRSVTEVTTVRTNAETALGRPLRITPPSKVAVLVVPPLDPLDRPWSLALQESSPSGTSFRVVQIGKSSPAGEWTSKPLPWGEYTLLVEDGAGDRWAWEDVTLDSREATLTVQVQGVTVDGRVTLDGEPLEADLYFGGKHGRRSLHLESDSEGRFGGYLPETGDWPVTVEARDPKVSRLIRAVPVETMGMGDAADVRINLPANQLRGLLLDDQGQPATGSVLVMAAELRQRADQVMVGTDGVLEIHGLEPGPYVLQGLGSGGAGKSWPVRVEVPEKGESPEVELRLRRDRLVEGVVRGPHYPVPGAAVLAVPQGPTATPTGQIVLSATTDVQGKYSLTVPADVEELDVVVLPPGFALTTLRLTLPEQPELYREDIPVYEAGGSLVLQVSEQRDHWSSLTISRDGVEIGYSTLLQWASLQGGGPTGSTIVVPEMSFGDYRVCLLRDVRNVGCRDGYLQPGGELDLEFPDASG